MNMSQPSKTQLPTLSSGSRQAWLLAGAALIPHVLMMTFYARGGYLFIAIYDILVAVTYVTLKTSREFFPNQPVLVRHYLHYLFRIGLLFAILLTAGIAFEWGTRQIPDTLYYSSDIVMWSTDIHDFLLLLPYLISCGMLELFGRADGVCY
ncbi:MAG: hypothetical protein IID44_03720 [Planctomycetes bacterium]|nr:hypothetical protein [Planctomycetota bacterium]